MKKYIQIYMGGVEGRNITCGEMESRLALFGENMPDGIIAGWSLDQEIYKWLRKYTAERDIELYLWFQILSEFRSLKSFAPVREIGGGLLSSLVFDEDEEFSFYCPSHRDTVNFIKQIYEQYFSDIQYDGIFLDRLRFPSSSLDRNAIFSCCCADCLRKYEEQGITEEEIKGMKEYANRNMRNIQDKTMFGIEEYKDGKFTFRDKHLEKYLNARTTIISDLTKELTGYFRAKGLKTGLDLFAPCLAVFVGQDYRELSKYADFIKPMLYRYTDTPAGLMYELRGMAEAFSDVTTIESRMDNIKKIIGMEGGSISEFMIQEMRIAEKLSYCDVYAGMEIHTLPDRERIRSWQIREGVELLDKNKAGGRIASWNIMTADRENISAFMGDTEDEA